MTDSAHDTLDAIITDLLNEVFKGAVSLEDLVIELLLLGGHDFSGVEPTDLLRAIRDQDSPLTNWHDIHFGCQETLAGCAIMTKSELRVDLSKRDEENRTMCAYLLCDGLFNDARIRHRGADSPRNLRYTLAPFTLYLDITGHFIIHDHLERLLRYIFRP